MVVDLCGAHQADHIADPIAGMYRSEKFLMLCIFNLIINQFVSGGFTPLTAYGAKKSNCKSIKIARVLS